MDTLLDQETVVIESLDFEPPCIDESEPEHGADTVLTCKACGKVLLVCEKHLAVTRWKYRDAIRHVPCGTWARGFDLLFTWRPL
jgi:hypothetical protein